MKAQRTHAVLLENDVFMISETEPGQGEAETFASMTRDVTNASVTYSQRWIGAGYKLAS